jgi:peptidoglycan/LPS O-acetylase OafA/YrhL
MHTSEQNDNAIEALRGGAALLVVATHYAPFLTPNPGMWGFASTGVNLFFVLSGFVFAPYLFGKPLELWVHLIRRIFRMYPLYICSLLLYVALKEPRQEAWIHFGTHLSMMHTLKSTEIAFFYNAAFWSLPPEVEFYLLLPILAISCKHLGFIPVFLFTVGMHLGLVLMADLADIHVSWRAIATVHAPGLLVQFLLGSAAYAMIQKNNQQHLRTALLGLGVVLLSVCFLLFDRYLSGNSAQSSSPPLWVSANMGLGAAFGYACIVGAVANQCRNMPHNLCLLFSKAGQLSYGVYLFHNASPKIISIFYPGTTGLGMVLPSVALTLVISALVNWTIETPCREWGRDLSHRLRPQTVAGNSD